MNHVFLSPFLHHLLANNIKTKGEAVYGYYEIDPSLKEQTVVEGLYINEDYLTIYVEAFPIVLNVDFGLYTAPSYSKDDLYFDFLQTWDFYFTNTLDYAVGGDLGKHVQTFYESMYNIHFILYWW